ncbi:MAG: hypothetical protein ACKOOI_03655 [Pirellula sp.]
MFLRQRLIDSQIIDRSFWILVEGLKKGEIHLIQTLQEILGLPLGDPASFQDRSLEQLQAISTELRQQIHDRICPVGPF